MYKFGMWHVIENHKIGQNTQNLKVCSFCWHAVYVVPSQIENNMTLNALPPY